MKRCLKNTAFYLLLTVAALPLLTGVWFVASQAFICWQVEQNLEKDLLVKVTVAADKIIWLKQRKEILINNEPFDVKKCETVKDSIKLTGLYDKQEKELKAMLNQQQSKQQYGTVFMFPFFQLPLKISTTFYRAENNITYLPVQYALLSGHYKKMLQPPDGLIHSLS